MRANENEQGNNNEEMQYTIFSGVDYIDTTINVENISFDQDLVNSVMQNSNSWV